MLHNLSKIESGKYANFYIKCQDAIISLQTFVAGAVIETDLSVTYQYGVGPGGQVDPATGLPYPGLYQIIFFPFNYGDYTIQVQVAQNIIFGLCLCLIQ